MSEDVGVVEEVCVCQEPFCVCVCVCVCMLLLLEVKVIFII